MNVLPGTIRGRIVALVVAVSVPLVGVLAWGFIAQINSQRADARASALRIARSVAEDLGQSNARARTLLALLKPRVSVDCYPLFGIADFLPQYPRLLQYDNSGNVVCASIPKGTDAVYAGIAEARVTRAIRSAEGAPAQPIIMLARDRWILVTFERVGPDGVLALMQYLDLDTRPYPAETIVTIADADRRIIARSREAQKWIGRTGNPTVAMRRAGQLDEGMVESRGIDGVRRDYGFRHVTGMPWTVFVGIPTHLTIAAVRALLLRGLAVGAAIIALVALLAIRITRTIERPLAVLEETVGRAAEPGFRGQVPIEGPREVEVVARAFNEMVASRADAERALVESSAQLTALSNKLLDVQEQERSRIAREIHDELGQLLTALNMDIGGLLASSELTVEQRAMAKRIRQALSETLSSVQRISAELRPPILDDFGLMAAIELELQKFEQRTGIECDLSAPPNVRSFGRDTDAAIFRIVQEAMTNVARHANATRLEVRLRARENELLVEVRDDGRGIPAAVIGNRSSLGLIGMRERARAIGGFVDIEGVAGHGTIVSLRVPVAA